MVQLNGTDKLSEPTSTYHSSESNLLKKLDIPLNHLDFEYVNNCKDANELGKILQILKSGEEGYYPQLIERTEQRLTEIKPNSKYLRKTVKVLNRGDIDKEKYEEISDDLTKWLNDVSKKNEELEAVRNMTSKVIPEVRQCKQVKIEGKESEKKASNRIKSTDYASWDKYDVETELLKMDLEDKKVKEQAEKLNKEASKKTSVRFNPFVTTAEAVFEVQRENEKGNEYFKQNEYETSIEHYSNSISYHRNSTSLKNRASAYMAIKKYESAITDYKEVLHFEKNDFDTLLRIGQCYQHLKRYNEAAIFIEKAIHVNPNETNAQKLAETVRKYIANDPDEKSSKIRMKVSNVSGEAERKDSEAKKSILRKEDKVIVPIPGTSKMSGPYYRVVNQSESSRKMQTTNNSKTKRNDKVVEFNLEKANKREENCQTSAANEKNIDNISKRNLDINNRSKNYIPQQQVDEILEIQEDLKAGGEPFISHVNQDITPEQIHMPYSFVQAWLTARKENNYTGFAKIIRNLDVHRLTEVIGNKLDATMLSEILNCLYRHFTVAHEVKKVYDLLRNLHLIDRFNIIIMFLSKEDKTLLQNLMNFLKQHGKNIPNNILQQYNLH